MRVLNNRFCLTLAAVMVTMAAGCTSVRDARATCLFKDIWAKRGEEVWTIRGTRWPIGKLLQDPKTDTAVIRMVKDYGRTLSTRAKSEAEHQAANTVYYAAIAHALVFHKLKITNFSYGDLQSSFSRLSQEKWITKGLVDLFAKASEHCKARVK